MHRLRALVETGLTLSTSIQTPSGGDPGQGPAGLRPRGARAAAARPSPATHAILRPLKAGETVYQTLFVTKRAFFTLNSLSDSVSDTFCTKNNV